MLDNRLKYAPDTLRLEQGFIKDVSLFPIDSVKYSKQKAIFHFQIIYVKHTCTYK